MSSGRRHKPAPLRVVGGTHRESRHGSADDVRAEAAANRLERLPCAPRWLGSVARAEWKRIAPMLHTRGLLSRRHVAALAGYCRAYGELVEAQRAIEKDGRTITSAKGFVLQHPAVGMANRAADQLRQFLVEFGLSPSAEGRLGRDTSAPKDAVEEFEREDAKHGAGHAPGPK